MNNTGQAANALTGNLTKLASAIAGVISVSALVSAFQSAVDVTMEFNAQISNLSAITGAVGKDLAVFRQAAIDIGGSTSLSATQAAEAMKLIGSASPELLKSAEALKAVTQEAVVLAEAAGIQLPQAATALTAAMNQFQLGADQASRVINVLAAGAKEGSSEIADTVEVMKNAGVVAAQAGLSFETFNGAIQALAKGEIKGAEAGTGLRNVLTILSTQAKNDLNPSIVGLSKALENLEKAGLSDTQMVKLFGRENITAAKVLLQFRGTMDEVTEAITGTSEAYDQARTNQNNLKGDVANLTSAFETLQIAVGDLSDNTLRELVQQFTQMISTFSSNSDAIANVFDAAATAGLSFAAVMAGRMAAGLGAFVNSQIAMIGATLQNIQVQRTAAAVALQRAEFDMIGARATTAAAAAQVAATAGTAGYAAALRALTVAQIAETAAVNAYTAAQARANTVAGVGAIVMGTLGRAMAFLGGPVGVILLAVVALYSFASASDTATTSADALTTSLEKLTAAQLGAVKVNLQSGISKLEEESTAAARKVDALKAGLNDLPNKGAFVDQAKSAENYNRALVVAQAELDTTGQKLDEYKNKIAEVDRQISKGSGPQPGFVGPVKPAGGGGIQAPTETDKGQESIDRLKQQLELSKLQGEARAKLAAIQQLGAEATEAEKEEASKLAAEIYRLDNAQKAASGSSKELTTEQKAATDTAKELADAAKQDADVIAQMGEALYQASLGASELVQRQAELTLSDYATPEQIEQVRALALQLKAANDEQQRKESFGKNKSEIDDKIRGEVDPLSGGAFDDQLARYDAEAAAEEQRYAAQHARLVEALELELITKQEYIAKEEQFRAESSARMEQIEKARTDMMISNAASGFAQMSSDIMAFANTFAKENKAMFAVAKAAAIASTIIETYSSAQKAFSSMAGIPIVGPALGAVAAAAAIGGGMARVAAIRSQSMSGKALGGPVQASGMYRVNETGAPEIFNAANGRQYMMPNTRGEVVSNKDATASEEGYNGGMRSNITQNIYLTGEVDNRTTNQMAAASAQKQRIAAGRFSRG
jgi:TP901 family phage tail tape measure protein